MNWKRIDRLVAAAVFLYALVLYVLTVAPTASFWDAGEFIAIAHGLQVSHPPGAPFYMLVGRLFSIVLSPLLGAFAGSGAIALAINLVSVLASALTILLTHLIIVRLIKEWQGEEASWTTADRISALAGGVIGACTFAVTDSFWFNAVEAEVYAMSMFFTAIVVWLIMKWNEQAVLEEATLAGGHHPFGLQANRYLVLIAYLFGLAIGVHLLNVLTLFFIALIFFFSELDRDEWPPMRRWFGIAATGLVSALGFFFIYPVIIQWLPKWAGESGNPFFFLIAILGLVVAGIYYTQQKRMQIANLVMVSVLMILIGYSTYTLIFIRSAADPPIDENDPETTEAIVSYLAREQYGDTPLLSGNSYNNALGRIDTRTEKLFPRRHSSQPSHLRLYRQYDSDAGFFWGYQVDHMYLRYFMWNFVGKASDEQDAPWISGIKALDGPAPTLLQTPSEKASRNAYFALPLLLGLMGMMYHFSRDWRRAFSVLVLFVVTGLGIIVYLNQTPMQPRERDYSYVASFFAFSLWVGIGATGILQMVREALQERVNQGLLLGVSALLFVAVPGWMAYENFDDHDRSGQYVAPEYAYNMLMSLEKDAIVFTNGDNDTFPLWYLQEVEGVRQDVRVVNLSLLNTSWYVRQLKDQYSRASAPLPISLSDDQIEKLGVVQWEPTMFELTVNKPQLLRQSEVYIAPQDTAQIESPMRWRLEGRKISDDLSILYAADIVALDILRTNAAQDWKRPVYFAVTVSPDGQLDLQNYFQLEGQAYRVVPIKHEEKLGRVVPGIADKRLGEFRFTNLNNPEVYYDENIRRMVDNYRNIYSHTASALGEQGKVAEARALLDTLMQSVPFEIIPGDERSFLFIAQAYQSIGENQQAASVLQKAEPLIMYRLENIRSQRDEEYALSYIQMMRLTYLAARDFEAAAAFDNRLATFLGDTTEPRTPEALQKEYEDYMKDTLESVDSTTGL